MRDMPFRKPVVATSWGQETVDYVVADRKSGVVRVMAAGSVPRQAEDEEERSPGELLSAELKRLGFRRLDLVVGLGRANVDVIPLQLPPAGDDELPTMVANQVMRDAGDVAESGVVDFVAVPAEADEPRTGFAFAVDKLTMEQVSADAAAASLKPSAIVYRPLASLTLLQRVVPPSSRTMILVTLHDHEADISIVRQGGLVYTRTARLSETANVGDLAAQLAMEVRRSLAAASLTPDAEDQHLYLFGALQETEQLVQDLAEELSLPASLLDPLRSEQVDGPTPERVGRLAPLLGMVYSHYGDSHAIDFLHPKEPPPPPNHLRRIAVYAAAVALLAAVGLYMVWEARSETAGEIADLKTDLKNTQKILEKIQKQEAVVDAVWRWQSDNVNWLDEFHDLAQRFPSGKDAMIRRFSVSPGRGGKSVINLSVHVRDPDVITQLGDQLRDDYHDVRNRGVSEQSSSEDYPWQFDTTITLRPRKTDEYRGETTPSDESEKDPDGDIAASLPAGIERELVRVKK